MKKSVRICLLMSTGNDTLYWTDLGLNRISRVKRDQTWREDIVTSGIGRVEGIAVDWIAGRVTAVYQVLLTLLQKYQSHASQMSSTGYH